MANNSLFDDAFGASRFQYLSDLHYSHNCDAIVDAIMSLTATNYSLNDWNSLAEYITGKKIKFQHKTRHKSTCLLCQKKTKRII